MFIFWKLYAWFYVQRLKISWIKALIKKNDMALSSAI